MAVTRKTLAALVAVAAAVVLVATVAYAVGNTGGGRYGSMHRSGYAMMGVSGQRAAWYLDGSGPVTDIAGARARAQRFADRLGLKTGEVLQFSENFYVRLDDGNGKPATEVLVDPRSGDVTIEYGAAMMWNTRYGAMRGAASGMMNGAAGSMMGGTGAGMMGTGAGNGMMGRYGATSSATGIGRVDADGARAAADRWLAAHADGARAGAADAFPGYFTMETQRDGKITGMISVNARTGAVLYHWWHGSFVAEG